MGHVGPFLSLLASAALLCWVLLRPCPGVVQQPEPGGGSSPAGQFLWRAYHLKLADEVAAAGTGQGLDLVFYGDSITENWRGTSLGRPWPGGRGVAEVYENHFGGYRSAVLAVAGDQVGNLWWRLLHGELPLAYPNPAEQGGHAMRGREPRVMMVMIGTNDLGAADCHRNATELLAAAPGVAERSWLLGCFRVSAVVQLLRAALPRTRLVLQALLPRGMDLLPLLRFRWPNRGTAALAAVNSRFQAMADEHAGVHYVDCGQAYISQSAGGTSIAQDLMPDGLHPNAAGMERLAQCLDPLIARLMAQPVVDFSTAQEVAHARPQAPSSLRVARVAERDA